MFAVAMVVGKSLHFATMVFDLLVMRKIAGTTRGGTLSELLACRKAPVSGYADKRV